MQLTIQSIHFDADQKLLDFIEEKTTKLNTLHPSIHKIEISLRLEKNINHENKIAEYTVKIPGTELFAKKQCKSFEEAVDNCIDALKKQVERIKDK
jgi:putative sigma-54 modulation protein